MSNICNPDCLTVLPNFEAIDSCDLIKSLRSGEIAKIIVGRCDLAFADILDVAEWTTKKANGDISIMMAGNGSLGEKSYTNTLRISCKDIDTGAKKPFEFMTYLGDNVAYTEYSVYNDLISNKLNVGIMFLTCDGFLLINPSWATGDNPLLNTSKINFDQIFSGEANSQAQWKISGEISEDNILKPVKLTSAVLAVL